MPKRQKRKSLQQRRRSDDRYSGAASEEEMDTVQNARRRGDGESTTEEDAERSPRHNPPVSYSQVLLAVVSTPSTVSTPTGKTGPTDLCEWPSLEQASSVKGSLRIATIPGNRQTRAEALSKEAELSRERSNSDSAISLGSDVGAAGGRALAPSRPELPFEFKTWSPWESPDILKEVLLAIKSVDPDTWEPCFHFPGSPPSAGAAGCSYSIALKTPSVAPAPRASTSSAPPSVPSVQVLPLRSVNFTGVPIQFLITMDPGPLQRVHVEAVPPSGTTTLDCHVLKKNESRDTVQVLFVANAEVGWYKIHVKCQGRKKDMMSTVPILVSRNYFRDSAKPDSGLVFKLNSFGAGSTQPDNIWGFACDRKSNRLYYSESQSHVITCIDPGQGGKVIFRAKGAFSQPTGLCCDERKGRLVFCERGRHRVVFLDLDSAQIISSFGSFGEAEGMFRCPWDVSISPSGQELCVSDLGNNRLQVFDSNGAFLRQYPVDNPGGVAFGNHDDIYTTSWVSGTITEVVSGRQWRSGGNRSLRAPQGLVVDTIGSLLVADKGNNSVRHFTTGPVKPDEDHQLSVIHKAAGAPLDSPVNLALLGDGRLAILEESGRICLF